MNAVILINFILVVFLGFLASIPSSLLVVKLFSPQQNKAKDPGEDIYQQVRADELERRDEIYHQARQITDQIFKQLADGNR